VKIDLAKYFS